MGKSLEETCGWSPLGGGVLLIQIGQAFGSTTFRDQVRMGLGMGGGKQGQVVESPGDQ